jgi:hypothetical protein
MKICLFLLLLLISIQTAFSQEIVDTLDEEYLKTNITKIEEEIIWADHKEMAELYKELLERNNDQYLEDLYEKRIMEKIGLSLIGSMPDNRNVYADYSFNSMVLSKLIEFKIEMFLEFYVNRGYYIENIDNLYNYLELRLRSAEIIYEKYSDINLVEDTIIFIEQYILENYNKLFE